jgi:cytochrome c556
MAEIEIHHEPGGDPPAKRVGLMVGVIGVALAVVTIASHREHTHAVLRRTEANDLWGYYQAKKIREHTSAVGGELLRALSTDAARVEAAAAKFEAAKAKYAADAEAIQKDARAKEEETEYVEALALRYDLGEGFLELGLVLTSLFFLGRQRLFPLAGGFAASAGAVIAASALLL